MKIKLELILISIFILIYLLIGFVFQKQITHNEGLGWDGRDYYKISLDFKNNQQPETRAPFVYRMGTSYLVAKLFPDNIQLGFKIINITAGSLVIYALWYFLFINGINYVLRLVLVFSYTSYWQNPLRLSFFYPVHSDPLGVLFLFINLIIAFLIFKNYKRNLFFLFAFISFLGVFFREITLIPAIVLFIATIKHEEKFKFKIEKKYLLPLLSGLIAIFITHLIGTPTDTYSFFNSAVGWIYRKSTIMYIHSLLLSVGPIIVLAFYFYKDSIQFLKDNRFVSIFLFLILFVSYAGGSDTERLIMWGIPGIYLLLSKVIIVNKTAIMSKLLITVLIISQLLSNRAILLTPDFNENAVSVFPFLTPISYNFPLLDLWVIHANSRFILISAIEYFILALLITFLIKFSNKLKQI